MTPVGEQKRGASGRQNKIQKILMPFCRWMMGIRGSLYYPIYFCVFLFKKHFLWCHLHPPNSQISKLVVIYLQIKSYKQWMHCTAPSKAAEEPERGSLLSTGSHLGGRAPKWILCLHGHRSNRGGSLMRNQQERQREAQSHMPGKGWGVGMTGTDAGNREKNWFYSWWYFIFHTIPVSLS